MSNKKEAFAALDGYPKDGPEMPEREKVHRDKNKHESGTGRRDREKREGRGQSNWGNALDDQLADYHEEDNEEVEEPQENPTEKKDFKPAAKYFEDDDDNENEKKASKQTVKVPPGYGKIVKAGENVEVVEVDDSNDPDRKLPKPQPKLEKKPKREPYHPEKEEVHKEEEEEDNDQSAKRGKKSRDKQFHSVQHNRDSHIQPPPQIGGP